MSRFSRSAVGMVLIVVALCAAAFSAYAQQTDQSRRTTLPAARGRVMPSPLPQSAAVAPSPKPTSAAQGSGWVDLPAYLRAHPSILAHPQNFPVTPYTGTQKPPIPGLTSLLNKHFRKPQSASGATIVLTGSSGTPFLDDQTLAYNEFVYWVCENLQANTSYQYVVFEPNGTAHNINGAFTTDGQGRCATDTGTINPIYASLYLGTPFVNTTTPGTNPAYSGVWTIAVKNTGTGNYEAVAYTGIIGEQSFATYTDSTYTTKATNYNSGDTVYVQATGLNPAHTYALGFVNTSGNTSPCVYTLPVGSGNVANNTCFKTGTFGTTPTGGVINGSYTTPTTGANSLGTQTVELYDTVESNDSSGAGVLIGTRQFSLNPSTVGWTITPFNTAGTLGTNLNDTFATDGLIAGVQTDQSVAGIQYTATGLTANRSYLITVSNANGVVMQSTTTDTANPEYGVPQFFTAPPAFTSNASGVISNAKVAFPINLTNLTSFGATQIPFLSNVYSAQLYDTVTKTVVASKAFTILSYSANFAWTSPAGSSAKAGLAGIPVNVTTTVTNNGGVQFGNNNADSLQLITIKPDQNNYVTLGLQATTTATDSNAQVWNITKSGNNVVATPQVAGESLANGATLAIPFTISTTNTGKCTATPCILENTITPLHGIDPSATNFSMSNTAANGLVVYDFLAPANSSPTYSLTVGASGDTTNLPAPSPRYNQMSYQYGTNGATSNLAYYPITFTFNTSNAGQNTTAIQFAFPPSYNPNIAAGAPCLKSMTINGTNDTANWEIITQNAATPTGISGCTTSTVASTGYTIGQNFIILALANNKTTPIPQNATATAVIDFPIFTTPFPFQEIIAEANVYDFSRRYTTVTQYQLLPTSTVTNDIAGATNLDSTELGVFTLDTSSMSGVFNPSTVPTPKNTSTVLKYLNTTTEISPNPDYINQINLTVPAGAIPSSITATNPNDPSTTWYVNNVSAGKYRIELCTPGGTGAADCSAANDLKSIPPGGELDITFNYTTASPPTVGTYNVTWTVQGANGGLITNTNGTSVLNIANTTAQTYFVYSGGINSITAPTWPIYPANPGTPIQVPSNTQPTVGSSSDAKLGNQFVYAINNNGSNDITDIQINIPSSNTSGQLTDTQAWELTPVAAPNIYVYGSGTVGSKCSGTGYASFTQPVGGSPGTPGKIVLSGCDLTPGNTMYVGFTALSPYDINSQFLFSSTVTTTPRSGINPSSGPTIGPVTTTNPYPSSTTERIVSDVRLQILIPSDGIGTSLFPSPYTTTGPSGSASAATSCPGCQYTNATTLIDLKSFTGTFTATDVLSATVYTDTTTGWKLYVGLAPGNPNTSSGQVSTYISNDSSSGVTGYVKNYTPASQLTLSATPTGDPQITGNNGTVISSWSGTTRRPPIDNIMSYVVNVSNLSVNNNTTTTLTLYYTVVPN